MVLSLKQYLLHVLAALEGAGKTEPICRIVVSFHHIVEVCYVHGASCTRCRSLFFLRIIRFSHGIVRHAFVNTGPEMFLMVFIILMHN